MSTAERKSKWSQEQIEMFERARRYIEEASPQIQQSLEEFNQSNEVGWKAKFRIGSQDLPDNFRWGFVIAVMPNQGRRAQLIDRGKVYQAPNHQELVLIGEAIAKISDSVNLRARRIPSFLLGDWETGYSLKPHFDQFK